MTKPWRKTGHRVALRLECCVNEEWSMNLISFRTLSLLGMLAASAMAAIAACGDDSNQAPTQLSHDASVSSSGSSGAGSSGSSGSGNSSSGSQSLKDATMGNVADVGAADAGTDAASMLATYDGPP